MKSINKTTVNVAIHNYSMLLERSFHKLREYGESDKHLTYIALYHSTLAMLHLLMDDDSNRFVEGMCKSASCRLYFLRDFAPHHPVDPKYMCTTTDQTFYTSYAAGNFDLARNIAKYSPLHHNPELEEEQYFVSCKFFYQIIQPDVEQNVLSDLLLHWEALLEGQTSITLLVCKAICTRDTKAFNKAFGKLITARRQQLREWKQNSALFNHEKYLAEANIYVPGLSLLKIAQNWGIEIKDQYPMIPSNALKHINVSFPDEDCWREP